MRIKSIKPTDKLIPVPMREMVGRSDLAVLSPSNENDQKPKFSKVKNFGLIKTGPTIDIEHHNGKLRCDPQHKILTVDGDKFARDIVPGVDRLCGIDGPISEFNKCDGPVSDLWDIEIDAPHHYYTSGLVSHNSIWLCNNSVNSVNNGYDTLHVTCEMSNDSTARRVLGAMTQRNIKTVDKYKDEITGQVNKIYNTNQARLAIYEFNPEEISVDHISALIKTLNRTHSFQPKVIVIDYLELLMSRRNDFNREDYDRQKHVSVEVCGLAKTQKSLIYSATQTNRSGSGQKSSQGGQRVDSLINLNQTAESFGKMMPVHYVISLNQTAEQRTADQPVVDMMIAKNREGPKNIVISCNISYETMKVIENHL